MKEKRSQEQKGRKSKLKPGPSESVHRGDVREEEEKVVDVMNSAAGGEPGMHPASPMQCPHG